MGFCARFLVDGVFCGGRQISVSKSAVCKLINLITGNVIFHKELRVKGKIKKFLFFFCNLKRVGGFCLFAGLIHMWVLIILQWFHVGGFVGLWRCVAGLVRNFPVRRLSAMWHASGAVKNADLGVVIQIRMEKCERGEEAAKIHQNKEIFDLIFLFFWRRNMEKKENEWNSQVMALPLQ